MPSGPNRPGREASRVKRPLVVKFGTSLVVGTRQQVRRQVLRARAREVAQIVRDGTPVCIVVTCAVVVEGNCEESGATRRRRNSG